MNDDAQDAHELIPADLAILRTVEVTHLGAWMVQITAAHATGACIGWAPVLFASEDAAQEWLDLRSHLDVRPAVRDCIDGPHDLACAVLVDGDDRDLLVSEPVPRTKAAGVAALFAAEFRASSRR